MEMRAKMGSVTLDMMGVTLSEVQKLDVAIKNAYWFLNEKAEDVEGSELIDEIKRIDGIAQTLSSLWLGEAAYSAKTYYETLVKILNARKEVN